MTKFEISVSSLHHGLVYLYTITIYGIYRVVQFMQCLLDEFCMFCPWTIYSTVLSIVVLSVNITPDMLTVLLMLI